MSKIADGRHKSPGAKKNVTLEDVVLIRDKDTHRTIWSAGTVTDVNNNSDRLVRSSVVRPHKRPDKATTEAPRERAVVDLVIIRGVLDNQQYKYQNSHGTKVNESTSTAPNRILDN